MPRPFHIALSFLLLVALMVALTSRPASAVVVNCDVGPNFSIQTQLNAGQTQIDFDGTCNEFVFIFADGTRVTGASPATSIITGGLTVDGADRTRIEDLTVNGGGGFTIRDGANARVTGSTVQNTTFGFAILRNAFAILDGNIIGPATGTTSDICAALCVGEGSGIRMTNTSVTAANNDPAVGGTFALFRDAVGTLRGGNTITSTGSEPAVDVLFNSTLRLDDPSLPSGSGGSNGTDTITGSSLAVRVFGESYAEPRNTVVNGASVVDLKSTLRLGGPFGSDPNNIVLNGTIDATAMSAVSIFDPAVTVNGNITCDKTSHAEGGFQGTGKFVRCRDFDGKNPNRGDDDDDD